MFSSHVEFIFSQGYMVQNHNNIKVSVSECPVLPLSISVTMGNGGERGTKMSPAPMLVVSVCGCSFRCIALFKVVLKAF